MDKCLECGNEKETTEAIKLKCSHVYCWICLNTYLKENLNPKIKCPKDFCYEMIRDNQIRRVLREEDIDKYEKLCLGELPKTYKCLLTQCKTPVCYKKSDVQISCPNCTLYNCIQCKAAHSFISCKDFQSKTQSEKDQICEVELERAKQVYNNNKGDISRKMLLEFDAMDLLKNDEVFTCDICGFNIGKGDGVKLQNCYHCFCKKCLVDNIEATHKIPAQCPTCSESINDREIQAILSTKQLSAYQEKCKNIAKRYISHFQCQTPDCDVLYEISDSLKEFTCKKCKGVNCVKCKAVHLNENCQQFEIRMNEDVNLKAIEEKIRNKELMKCPQCNNLIAKTSGCNWIQCSNCLIELCWIRQMVRWGPGGRGDNSGGCKCMVNGIPCHPNCTSTCYPHVENNNQIDINPMLNDLMQFWMQMLLQGRR